MIVVSFTMLATPLQTLPDLSSKNPVLCSCHFCSHQNLFASFLTEFYLMVWHPDCLWCYRSPNRNLFRTLRIITSSNNPADNRSRETKAGEKDGSPKEQEKNNFMAKCPDHRNACGSRVCRALSTSSCPTAARICWASTHYRACRLAQHPGTDAFRRCCFARKRHRKKVQPGSTTKYCFQPRSFFEPVFYLKPGRAWRHKQPIASGIPAPLAQRHLL